MSCSGVMTMQKLYEKSELWFALAWIAVYVAGCSAADQLSAAWGVEKVVSLPFLALLSMVAWGWVRKNGLLKKYGLCKSQVSAKSTLYYLPLLLFVSCNFWFGIKLQLPLAEALLYMGSMICVGFLEELLFRGFLFRAMSRDGLHSAIIVSSMTFGIGHIVNLFNGSGMSLLSNLCQVVSAIAFGFLFVILFHRGGSLWPCILAHITINVSSVFANESRITDNTEILTAVILTVGSLLYTLILLKTLPPRDASSQ